MKSFFLCVLVLLSVQSCQDPKPQLRDKTRKDRTATQLLFRNDCFSCHRLYTRSIGPSYLDVASKYTATEENSLYLTKKIIHGGGGIWGGAVMSGHPFLTDEEAIKLVEWILGVNEWNTEKTSDTQTYEKTVDSEGTMSWKTSFVSSKAEHILFFLESNEQVDLLIDGELIIGAETSGGEAVFNASSGLHTIELLSGSSSIDSFKLFWMRESMDQLERVGN